MTEHKPTPAEAHRRIGRRGRADALIDGIGGLVGEHGDGAHDGQAGNVGQSADGEAGGLQQADGGRGGFRIALFGDGDGQPGRRRVVARQID